MNNDTVLHAHSLPWVGGYKVYGPNGYTAVLLMKHGAKAPVEIPQKLTYGEFEKIEHKFDEVCVYPMGGLFV